jgi:alkylation response protein AidB-like acyl-CoA dehydrogenase
MAFAHTEKGSRYNLSKVDATAKKAGANWEVTGEKFVVLGAPSADTFVVSAKTDKGLSLFLVKKESAKVKAYVTLDEQRAGDVCSKAPGELLGTEGGAPVSRRGGLRHGADLRRGSRRDEIRLRHHARVPEDAQARGVRQHEAL